MKRVLVTGASGFIGRCCLGPLVEKGYEVHATCRRDPSRGTPDVRWHPADLLAAGEVSDLVAEVRPTHLLHFAWVTTPGSYWTSTENLRWVSATLHLLSEFAAAGGRRSVIAGTCAEYDWSYGYLIEDRTPIRPSTLYGAHKGALRLMAESFCRQVGIGHGWGRIFFLFGPGEHPDRLVPSTIRPLLAGETARCTAGTQIRDFLFVEDAADAFVELLDSDSCGDFNICSGRPISVRELVERIGEKLGRPRDIEFGALEMRQNEVPLLVGHGRKLADVLGWEPGHTLDLGLEKTIQWWKGEAGGSR